MKISVIKVSIPSKSELLKDGKTYKYSDSYQSTYADKNNTISSVDIAKAFFSSVPKSTEKLFALRNRIVSVFGLKTPDKQVNRKEQLDNFTCDVGTILGFFNVYTKTENEIILGEDDKHLNFRVSLLKSNEENENKKLTITTVVEFNNWFGKLYFLPVKPFHKLIVPQLLKGIIKTLEN